MRSRISEIFCAAHHHFCAVARNRCRRGVLLCHASFKMVTQPVRELWRFKVLERFLAHNSETPWPIGMSFGMGGNLGTARWWHPVGGGKGWQILKNHVHALSLEEVLAGPEECPEKNWRQNWGAATFLPGAANTLRLHNLKGFRARITKLEGHTEGGQGSRGDKGGSFPRSPLSQKLLYVTQYNFGKGLL